MKRAAPETDLTTRKYEKPERPCKPSSVPAVLLAVANIRLGPWLPRSLISERTRERWTGNPFPLRGMLSYWLLLQVGFAVPAKSP